MTIIESENRERDEAEEMTTYQETVGRDTPEGREGLRDALQGLRDLAAQHESGAIDEPDWRIPEETKATGRRGIAEARAALKATDERRAAREAASEEETN